MSSFPHQLRRPSLLLILAALLLVTAQFLPWEHMEVSLRPTTAVGRAESLLGPVQHVCLVYSSELTGSVPDPEVWNRVIPDEPVTLVSFYFVRSQDFPRSIACFPIDDLMTVAREFPWHASFADLCKRNMLHLFIWSATLIAIVIIPFSIASLSRSRAVIWLARMLTCTLLVWLIGTPILVFANHSLLFPHIIGSGYWLTLAALVVEITALFLIPNAAKHHQQHAS